MTAEGQVDPVAVARRAKELLLAEHGENLVSVALYGSASRGEWKPGSDIDLLVVVEAHEPGLLGRHAVVVSAAAQIKAELRSEGVELLDLPYVSFVVKQREAAAYHSALYLDLTEDAKLLHDKDEFLSGVLGEMRARMRELGSRRVWLEGGWYWDLKPDLKWGEEVVI